MKAEAPRARAAGAACWESRAEEQASAGEGVESSGCFVARPPYSPRPASWDSSRKGDPGSSSSLMRSLPARRSSGGREAEVAAGCGGILAAAAAAAPGRRRRAPGAPPGPAPASPGQQLAALVVAPHRLGPARLQHVRDVCRAGRGRVRAAGGRRVAGGWLAAARRQRKAQRAAIRASPAAITACTALALASHPPPGPQPGRRRPASSLGSSQNRALLHTSPAPRSRPGPPGPTPCAAPGPARGPARQHWRLLKRALTSCTDRQCTSVVQACQSSAKCSDIWCADSRRRPRCAACSCLLPSVDLLPLVQCTAAAGVY